MAKTTVDLVLLLKTYDKLEETAVGKDVTTKMGYITVWSDGSYLLADGNDKPILDSEDMDSGYTATDIHGLLYMTQRGIDHVSKEFADKDTLTTDEAIKLAQDHER